MTKKGWRADRRNKPLSVDLDPALYEALKTLSQGDADHPPTSIGSQIRWILRNWFLKVKGIEIPLPPILSAGRPKGIHTPKKKVAPPQAFVVQSEGKLPQPVENFRRVAKTIHIGKAAAETDKGVRVPNAAYQTKPDSQFLDSGIVNKSTSSEGKDKK